MAIRKFFIAAAAAAVVGTGAIDVQAHEFRHRREPSGLETAFGIVRLVTEVLRPAPVIVTRPVVVAPAPVIVTQPVMMEPVVVITAPVVSMPPVIAVPPPPYRYRTYYRDAFPRRPLPPPRPEWERGPGRPGPGRR